MNGLGENCEFDMTQKISAIVLIGGNYDRHLFKRCLDSLAWCSEIVKIDTDRLKGSFSDWRNLGAKKASGNWLLYVDSDEEVTNNLKKEILEAAASNNSAAFAIPRRNIFLGHEMHWGGWSPDYVIRLIKKDSLVRWYGDLHEQPEIKGRVAYLKARLIHTSHRNLTEMVDKTNKWSEIEARLLYNSHHPRMNFFRFTSAAFREFWYRAVVKLGFLDGTPGVIEIIYQVYSRLITYSKLWELQLKNQ